MDLAAAIQAFDPVAAEEGFPADELGVGFVARRAFGFGLGVGELEEFRVGPRHVRVPDKVSARGAESSLKGIVDLMEGFLDKVGAGELNGDFSDCVYAHQVDVPLVPALAV